MTKLMAGEDSNLRSHSGCCSQPCPATSAGILLPSCHLEAGMMQLWGDSRSWHVLKGWQCPPCFFLAALGMGSPTSWACPGPDSGEGSGPGSGALGEQRDERRGGSGGGCLCSGPPAYSKLCWAWSLTSPSQVSLDPQREVTSAEAPFPGPHVRITLRARKNTDAHVPPQALEPDFLGGRPRHRHF